LTDRRHFEYLLAPTHEEEITSLVANTVNSYKNLPLRVYQISEPAVSLSVSHCLCSYASRFKARKYRDERRPRQGILRAREFTMKDLYSFDLTESAAMETYQQVREAYSRLFQEMKLPMLEAKASSGDMGGDLSHEYHLSSEAGDDTVIHCSACKHTFNEEVPYTLHENNRHRSPRASDQQVWHGISRDRKTLVNVWYPRTAVNRRTGELYGLTADDINLQAVKIVFPDLDASVEDALPLWEQTLSEAAGGEEPRLVQILDGSLNPDFKDRLDHDPEKLGTFPPWFSNPCSKVKTSVLSMVPGEEWSLVRPRNGDICPACGEVAVEVHKAIELGHTFYLGKRYTEPFEATVNRPSGLEARDVGAKAPSDAETTRTTLHMGCYGIGVSRIIGAVADHFADKEGLQWPRAIAPYEVVVVSREQSRADADDVYDMLANATTVPVSVAAAGGTGTGTGPGPGPAGTPAFRRSGTPTCPGHWVLGRTARPATAPLRRPRAARRPARARQTSLLLRNPRNPRR
jgi:prolyl-tRNA synthetase